MDSKNCRHPFIQFVCLQTFPPCSGPPEIEYCSYCTLAEVSDLLFLFLFLFLTKKKVFSLKQQRFFIIIILIEKSISQRFCQSSLPFNCSNYCTLTTDDEDNGSYNGSYNGPETVPVLTCVNETSSNITCCPNPFFLSSKTEECEYPRCPFYAYGKDQQEALMYVYYIFSWISLLSVLSLLCDHFVVFIILNILIFSFLLLLHLIFSFSSQPIGEFMLGDMTLSVRWIKKI